MTIKGGWIVVVACYLTIHAVAEEAIYFMSDRDGQTELYRMTANGRGVTRMTDHNGEDTAPCVSPDGRWVVFGSTRHDDAATPIKTSSSLYRMKADGSDVRRLTFHDLPDTAPSWSLDGEWIAFQRNVSIANSDLYRMRPDGSDVQPLLESPVNELAPKWTPDGSRILFTREVNGGRTDIFSLELESRTVERLTFGEGSDQPSPSPDGSRFVYAHSDGDIVSLFVADVGGGNTERLTTPTRRFRHWSPAWSLDGGRIAFVSDEAFNRDILLIQANGDDLRNLTRHPADDSYPTWTDALRGLDSAGKLLFGVWGTLKEFKTNSNR
ncbi:MAG: DUF5050 domain-containing protein [Candidatus Poribacteria bacterium]|nr:DUF5050 domain-containing protein [Candidatus Poribacteria bacterium]